MDKPGFREAIGEPVLQEIDPIEKVILRSMREGVITLECNGNLFTVNPSALRILGFKEEELVGKSFEEVFSHDPGNARFKEIFATLVHDGVPTHREEARFTRPDGQTVDLSITTTFLEIDECRPFMENVVTVFRDITALKALERMRKRAVDHLSHELKTPLAIIEASLNGLIRKTGQDSDVVKNIDRIARNLDRLKGIQQVVEEVLNPRPNMPKAFDAASQVQRTVREIVDECAFRQVRISTRLAAVHTDSIDPEILGLVLRTLVKNAVENSPDESEVTVILEPDPQGVILKVEDRGIGIPIADQEFIFEGFHHTQPTDEYSSKHPYEFNAGGKGLELLRLKVYAEKGFFRISFRSDGCRYILSGKDHCPGRISECPHVESIEGCRDSGGTTFSVLFPERKRLAPGERPG